MKGNRHGKILGYYQGTFPEGLRKMTEKKLVHDVPCPGQDSKCGPSERNSEAPCWAHTVTHADRTIAPAPRISHAVMTWTTRYCKFDCIRGIQSAASHLFRHIVHTDVACNGECSILFFLYAHRRTTQIISDSRCVAGSIPRKHQ